MYEEKSESNCLPSFGQSLGSSSSRIESHMLVKFNDYIVEGKYKYGVERTINYSSLNIENKRFVSNLNKTIEPKNYEEASLDPNLIKTMNDETEALYYNYTRTITILPKNYKPIGCKWVCKIKYKPSGEVERYNARLVAKDYNLREGVDY